MNILKESNKNGWTKVVKILLIVASVLAILQLWKLWQEPQLAQVFLVGMLILFVGAFSYGYYSIKLVDEGKTPKYGMGKHISIVLIVAIIGLGITYTVLSFMRPSISNNFKSDSYVIQNKQNYEVLATFDVKYTDNYYLSLKIKNEYPATIQVTDLQGNEVLSNTAMKMDKKGMKMNLDSGTYELRMSFASKDYQNSKVDIDYGIH